jgi:hypothetical protein
MGFPFNATETLPARPFDGYAFAASMLSAFSQPLP